MFYTILKAVHIIFMVSYFAGIFYLVRLFVYYKDTDDFDMYKQQVLREQYVYMIRRLWNIIIVPAAVIMTFTGIWMLIFYAPQMQFPLLVSSPFTWKMWFYVKTLFLIGLFGYHYWCWKKITKLKILNGGELPTKNIKLRQANEIATFILFLVVFTALLKTAIFEYGLQLLTGFFVLVVVIMLTVKLVNKGRR